MNKYFMSVLYFCCGLSLCYTAGNAEFRPGEQELYTKMVRKDMQSSDGVQIYIIPVQGHLKAILWENSLCVFSAGKEKFMDESSLKAVCGPRERRYDVEWIVLGICYRSSHMSVGVSYIGKNNKYIFGGAGLSRKATDLKDSALGLSFATYLQLYEEHRALLGTDIKK